MDDNPRIERQDDLSAIFGRNFYRLSHLDYSNVAADLAGLTGPSIVDARLWGDDAFNARVLMCLGFHKVCLQSILAVELSPEQAAQPPAAPAQAETVLDLDATLLDRHARNFHCNSLEFDPGVAESVWAAFNRMRLEQSLASPKMRHFVTGDGLVSFYPEGDKVVVDLLSVLNPRQGLGTALMRRVFDWSLANGVHRVEVTTECENLPAWLFYQKCGFRLTGTIAVFHRHAGDPSRDVQTASGCRPIAPRQELRIVPEAAKFEGCFSTQGR